MRNRVRHLILAIVIAGLMLVSAAAHAAENIGSLSNASFETSWTYRAGGVPSPPGGWTLAGWAATSGGPQYYTGSAELWNGRVSDHRCKWEFSGSGVSGNNVIAKEVNWGAYTSVTVTAYCAGRTWAGTTGTMSLGVDADGGGTQWSDCGANTTSRTSNDQSWSGLSKTISKPVGATTFTVMLNAVPNSTTWNCQFDNLTITGSASMGAIAGNVKDNLGANVSGATVSTTSGGYNTTTNSSGNYTLSDVAVATYSVVASKTGYLSQTKTGKTVTAGQTTISNFTIIRQTGAIAGNVKDSTGANISGATVSTTSGGYNTTTDASGNYTLSGVATGTYSVVAAKAGYNSQTQTGKMVNYNQTTTANLSLSQQNGTISGNVKNSGGANVSGAGVSTVTGGYSTTTDSGGNYTLSNVLTGAYDVVASKSGYADVTQTGQSVNNGQTTTVNFTHRQSENIGSLINACFDASWTYRAGSQPSPPGYWFLAGWGATGGGPQYYTGGELAAGRQSDHRCKYEFSSTGVSTNNVIAKEVNWGSYGTVTVTVWCAARTWSGTTGAMKLGIDADGGGSQWSDCGGNTVSRTSNDGSWAQLTLSNCTKPQGATSFTVMVNAVPNATTWNCQFDKLEITGTLEGGAISGSVKDTSNNGISAATVSTTTGGYSTTTNSGGSYTLSNVATGTYSVVAQKSGYNPSTLTGKTVTANQTTITNFTLTEATGGGAIAGCVRAPSGAYLSGAAVSTTTGGYSTTTSANGNYTLSNVAVGTYSVVAAKSGYQSVTKSGISVSSGTTTTVRYQMPFSYSKIGWHITTGSRNGYGAFLAQTASCGKPVCVIKCANDMSAAQEAKSYSSATLTIGRFSFANGWDMEGLNNWLGQTPEQAADTIYPHLKALWDQHPYIDVWEVCNEWDSAYSWQADYYIAMMDNAEADGFRLALFSPSAGTPSETEYSHIARACARAKQSGDHMLALHEYGLWEDGLMMNNPTCLVTRYRQLYNYLLQNDADIPIVMTEAGQGVFDFVGDYLFIQDFAWYDNQIKQDDYVLGAAAWTLGSWQNSNAESANDDLADYICNN